MGKGKFKEKLARIRQESENRRQRDIELAVTEGKDFYDKIKINAVKKLVWNDVIFVEDKAELESLSEKITNHLRLDGVIPFDKKITVGKFFGRAGSYSNSLEYEEAVARLFNTLAEISKEMKTGFIVNYSRQEDFMDGVGVFIQLGEVNFHPEIIIDGIKLLFTSADGIEENLFYLCAYKDYLAPWTRNSTLIGEIKKHAEDYQYWENFGDEELLKKDFVHFDRAEQKICASMLDSLNKYFQVNYLVDVIYGLTKQDNLGLCDKVRNKVLQRF